MAKLLDAMSAGARVALKVVLKAAWKVDAKVERTEHALEEPLGLLMVARTGHVTADDLADR